ncbi:site-specific integrase [Shewanella sp. NIFS-20-20]|uniref:tyrosine-type recombinase/integrase n=1 Tax=Shewanella sp. NIFS-20-20 TaxID=2853806 RepID=UPI001C44C409|nr:site-specific integrase [Shewanella sp. NIFS-20-20]MBV7315686.1 site-specific integrase [Shewanella sp. NIFS-20-20]
MTYPPVMPLFETAQFFMVGNCHVNAHLTRLSLTAIDDALLVYEHAHDWLSEQLNHENNFKAYRSELTCFLHWCFDVHQASPLDFSRRDIGLYVSYCQSPPAAVIGAVTLAQFKQDKASGERFPNPLWRPFVAKLIQGIQQTYQLSDNALKTKIAILSSFYTYLLGEEASERNPAQIWLNHSRFARKPTMKWQEDEQLQAFTELQWSYVMTAANAAATQDPATGERTLFMVVLLYSCYLRVSEISARAGFAPVMSQFQRQRQTGIWRFHVPLSKGGKKRTIAVSKALLQALTRYRRYLGLSDLPTSQDQHPLFVRHRAALRGRDAGLLNANLGIRQVREEIASIITQAARLAFDDGLEQDALEIGQMSAHSIRHTGITHDINLNQRPLSHVQADAGHESIDTTSQYLHTSSVERHQSAANKPVDHLAFIDASHTH